jgi:hypothetical protein
VIGFLILDDLVLPPPLPAVVSLFLVAGVAGLADAGLGRLRDKPDVVQRCAAFVVVVAVCGAVVHALALAHLAGLWILRVLACALMLPAFGLVWRVRRKRLLNCAARLQELWIPCTISGLTIVCLTLASLGPVTDADSLDYHLGVPLDWLRHGGIVAEPHWLHARVVGLGEAINMLGLAAGTDGLGAAMQVSGLVLLVVAIAALGKTARDRAMGMMLALPPAIIPLATAQKPQLLPTAAVVLAMLLARTADSGLDYALVFGCVGFAMACKYSFLVSGGAVAAAAFYWAWQKNRLGVALWWGAVSFGVLTVPVLARNVYLYGDPVSPFLESFRHVPQTEVLRFAAYLKDAGEPHNVEGAGRFLERLVVPAGVGGLQTVLGIGIFAVLAIAVTGWSGVELSAAAAVLLFTMWRGQMASRYLLEPYFWCAASVVSGQWGRMKSVLLYGLTVQTAGVAAMAAFAAFLLFPGALTPGLREKTMKQSTFGYEEARWMDRVVPNDATVMVESRAFALLSHPFVIPECAECGPAPLLGIFQPEDTTLRHVSVLVMSPVKGVAPRGCGLTTIDGPREFRYATRNPFNIATYFAIAMRVTCR